MNQKEKIKTIKSLSLEGIPFELTEIKRSSNVDSYIGKGEAFIPKNKEIKKDFYPIIQINFERVKSDNALLPKKGIYQFWVYKEANLYDDKEEHYFSCFYESPEDIETVNFSWPEVELDFIIMPFFDSQVVRMNFKRPKKTPIHYDSVLIPDGLFDEDSDEKFYEPFCDIMSPSGSYLLGNPRFTQGEIRGSKETLNFVQIDSGWMISIGDCGTFHLMISEDYLKNKNFENVWSYWDCY